MESENIRRFKEALGGEAMPVEEALGVSAEAIETPLGPLLAARAFGLRQQRLRREWQSAGEGVVENNTVSNEEA